MSISICSCYKALRRNGSDFARVPIFGGHTPYTGLTHCHTGNTPGWLLAECSTLLASGSDPTNVRQKMMEELSKNLMIAVCSTGCLCICKPTTRKAENSCITCEAQAYHQQHANLPAVVQMIEAIYICACVRHGVREIGAIACRKIVKWGNTYRQ